MNANKHTTWKKKIATTLVAICCAFMVAGAIAPSAIAQTPPATGTAAAATTTTATSTFVQNNYSSLGLNKTLAEQAADLVKKYNMPQNVAEFLVNLIVVITIILKFLYALLVPITGLIGKFMSNDWVTGTIFRLDILIETIWQFIRNIVNVVIVLYLVYVAARNIVPFGSSNQYDIKQVLPKVALALVIVNFSLFFCRTILSVANVTTTMAFSMPNQIGGQVFAGFNAVPDFNGKTTTAEAASAPWKNNGNTLTDNDTVYNPFVWAEPLGSSETKNLAVECDAGKKLTYVRETNASGGSVNVSKCVTADANGVVTPAAAADPTQWTNPKSTAAEGKTVYAMECLHKNYAFNLSDTLFSDSGPTLIANPGVDSSTGRYVIIPEYYKRITINTQPGDGEWTKTYREHQAKALFQKHATTPEYPYYSDCFASLDEVSFSARNAMYVYAFNLLRIPTYEKSFTDISSYADVTVRIMMAFFFQFMFFGVTIALLIAMVIRTFYIWVMMALSPLWVLTDILKIWKGDDVDEEGLIGGFSKFLSVAFLPTILGIILSVGFMMYHFLSLAGGLSGEDRGRLTIGSISLWFDPGDAVGGVGNLFSTIFGIFALAVMWVAVFAAFKFGFKGMKTVSTFINNFNKGATDLAKFAATSPLEHQLLPLGKDGAKISFSTLAKLPGEGMRHFRDERRAKEQRMLDAVMPGRGDIPAFAKTDFLNKMARTKMTGEDITSIMSQYGDTNFMMRTRHEMLTHIIDQDGNIVSESDLRAKGPLKTSSGVEISAENLIEYRKRIDPAKAKSMGPQLRDRDIQSIVDSGLLRGDSTYASFNTRLDDLMKPTVYTHGTYDPGARKFQYAEMSGKTPKEYARLTPGRLTPDMTTLKTSTNAVAKKTAFEHLRSTLVDEMKIAKTMGITADAFTAMVAEYFSKGTPSISGLEGHPATTYGGAASDPSIREAIAKV